MKIRDFLLEQDKYKVDETYQRPPDAWEKEDKQCLIDTILREEPIIPIFFLNFISDKDIFYIVDGQQRLQAIKEFYDNKFGLRKEFSGDANHEKTFGGKNPISGELRNKFLDYELTFKILEDYDDEKIRMIFSRLQRGKPLSLGETLNAKPGTIVPLMRKIAQHPFLAESIGIQKKRYGNYPDAARLLFYEKHGAKQSGTRQLLDFFEDNQTLDESDRDYKNLRTTLNYLSKCFPPDPGNYVYLKKHVWVLAVYTLVRELRSKYAMRGLENKVQEFIESFYPKVYKESFRASKRDYQRFYENVRGGWSENIIKLRRDILVKYFIKDNDLTEMADQRQISDDKKAEIFIDQGRSCQECGKKFKSQQEAEYHHIEEYSHGGGTNTSNIMLLCSECHKEKHRN